jgi:hypothetical protein
MESQAKVLRDEALWIDDEKKLIWVTDQMLQALASAMHIPDDISKMEANKALRDPGVAQYLLYFQMKERYEAMREVLFANAKKVGM